VVRAPVAVAGVMPLEVASEAEAVEGA
jgi:hypothetical protein